MADEGFCLGQGKARELVAHLDRRDRIQELFETGKHLRPDICWEQVQHVMLEAAQQNAPDPRRFQSKIDELRTVVANWDERVERQRQRVEDGLTEQRRRMTEENARQRGRGRTQVVGQPPLDVTDYFKDRERELVAVGRLLAEPATRLVSVVGHGGMGKTALACKVLRDL